MLIAGEAVPRLGSLTPRGLEGTEAVRALDASPAVVMSPTRSLGLTPAETTEQSV